MLVYRFTSIHLMIVDNIEAVPLYRVLFPELTIRFLEGSQFGIYQASLKKGAHVHLRASLLTLGSFYHNELYRSIRHRLKLTDNALL